MRDLALGKIIDTRSNIKNKTEKLPKKALTSPINVCLKGAMYRLSSWIVSQYVLIIFKKINKLM